MIQIKIDLSSIEKLIKNESSISNFKELSQVNPRELPPLIYTSFDGDLLSYSELMKQFFLKKHKSPLNPESALGTYLVTNNYKGEKKPIIEDCLSLIDMVDEFYIMSKVVPKKVSDIHILPEGVIAEIYYWALSRRKPIYFVNVNNFKNEKRMDITEEFIQHLKPQQISGIKQISDSEYFQKRDLVYLISGEKHSKHSDWMRQDAYDCNLVPLCPYTMLNQSTLYLSSNKFKNRIIYRTPLALKAKKIFLYSSYLDEEFNIDLLPLDALEELYLILKTKKVIEVTHKYFGEVGVPKYLNRKKWAITDYERRESAD